MSPEIISIKKDFWGQQKTTEIIWKYKERQMVNFIIDNRFHSEQEIYEYLNKLIKLNPLQYEN